MAECEKRYGRYIAQLPGRAGDVTRPIYLYETSIEEAGRKIPVRVRIEFSPQGRAWYIRYSGTFLEEDGKQFLRYNPGTGSWGSAETFNERTFFRTNALNPYHASRFRNGNLTVVEIFSYDCMKDQMALRAEQNKAILADPSWDMPTAPADDALKFKGL
jgi:hypothetical protein